MDDDIEILDIFDKKEEPKKELKNEEHEPIKKEEPMKRSGTKKRKLKTKALQAAFCIISALFILGCLVYYGSRFIKYYRIYNPKIDTNGEVLLANYIPNVASEIVYEGNGLYSVSGGFIYKGNVDNNYVKYNNMLWRIVRINGDKSIDIVLDDYISILPWNSKVSDFKGSEMHEYLNKDFFNNLDKSNLSKVNFCDDKADTVASKASKCEKMVLDDYVKLLDITDFLNSVNDKKSYLVGDDEIFWLSDHTDDKVWHTNGVNVSQSASNTFYEVRPVVKLNNTIIYKSGDGKKDTPYEVGDNSKLTIGSTILLGEDKWIVYDTNDNVKLMRAEVLDKKQIFDKKNYDYNESSLKEYLNKTYLDSLSYKDKIVDGTWYTGEYKEKLSDIKENKTTSKVGLPNIIDIKFNSKVNGYFTSTINEERVWVYENPLRPSRITSERSVRPCITISMDYAKGLVYQDGVFKEK